MSMEIRQYVCHNCQNREVYVREDGTSYNCHNHCERYAEEVKRCREAKERFEKKNLGYKLCMDYDFEKCERLNRKYRKKKGVRAW